MESIEVLFQDSVEFSNNYLNKFMKQYSFHQISAKPKIDNIIFQNFNESNTIMINFYNESDQKSKEGYFILGFQKTILIVSQSSLNQLHNLFSRKSILSICFLPEVEFIFNQFINIQYNKIEFSPIFETQISNFNVALSKINTKENKQIWIKIMPCISGFLIKQSYFMNGKDRIADFFNNGKQFQFNEKIDNEEYITLNDIHTSSLFKIELIYHIEKQLLLVKKIPLNYNYEESKQLIEREIENYKKISHPLFPKFYGTTTKNSIIIEFIEGNSLEKIGDLHLTDDEKIKIIFKLLMIIDFIHCNGMIYRDLKPNNIIIDNYQNPVLIDFNEMIPYDLKKTHTWDFESKFSAPELNYYILSFECDIFSLGVIIYFIMSGKEHDYEKACFLDFGEYPELYSIFSKMTYKDYRCRPSIRKVLYDMDNELHKKNEFEYKTELLEINTKSLYNSDNYYILNLLGQTNYKNNIDEAINYYKLSAKLNSIEALNNLGEIYLDKDVTLSIKYYTKVIKMTNYKDATSLTFLGYIFYFIDDVRNVNQALKYLSLADELNHPYGQYLLGFIYFFGDFVIPDKIKAINYLEKSIKQNYSQAHYLLGVIYLDEQYEKHDNIIAIDHFEKAANLGNFFARKTLSMIYYDGLYTKKDVNKSLQYLDSDNHPYDDYKFGFIYLISLGVIDLKEINNAKREQNLFFKINSFIIFCKKDNAFKIHRSIKYLIQTQDYERQLFILLLLFISKEKQLILNFFNIHDDDDDIRLLSSISTQIDNFSNEVEKALISLTEKNPFASLILGEYYLISNEKFDATKSVHYLTLAAKQGNPNSKLLLGFLYFYSKFFSLSLCHELSVVCFMFGAASNDAYNFVKYINIEHKIKFFPQNDFLVIEYFLSCLSESKYNLDVKNCLNLSLAMLFILKNDIFRAKYHINLLDDQFFGKRIVNIIFPVLIEYKSIYDQEIRNSINEILDLGNECDICIYTFLLAMDIKMNNKIINKIIRFLTIMGNMNCSWGHFFLAHIYEEGKIGTVDIKKAIYHYSYAAKLEHPEAQYVLGNYYISGKYVKKNVEKGFELIKKSSFNRYQKAHFAVGYLYHVGCKYIKQDINDSIHYYKEGSSINDAYSKNNLAIIYKNGFGNIVPKNTQFALELLKEAIKINSNIIFKYNLAHIYMYDENFKGTKQKIIDLLFDPSSMQFESAIDLLIIALIVEYKCDLRKIEEKTISNKSLCDAIKKKINKEKLLDPSFLIIKFECLSEIDYLFDFQFQNPFKSNELGVKSKEFEDPIQIIDKREKINQFQMCHFGFFLRNFNAPVHWK